MGKIFFPSSQEVSQDVLFLTDTRVNELNFNAVISTGKYIGLWELNTVKQEKKYFRYENALNKIHFELRLQQFFFDATFDLYSQEEVKCAFRCVIEVSISILFHLTFNRLTTENSLIVTFCIKMLSKRFI